MFNICFPLNISRFDCLQVVFLLSSCGTPSKNNLSLFTKFNAEMLDGGKGKKIVLETQYSSNTTLTMEVGLLENFEPVPFFALQNHKLIEDHLFSLTLENTGEKIVGLESEFSLKNFSNQSNLMLFVRFPRLVESGNPYAYHFLRLQVGSGNSNASQTPYEMESAEKNDNQVTPVYVNSVNPKDRTVELHINPELIFDGDFHTLYEENKDFTFEFILIGIQRNRLIPINSANYLFGDMRLADCKKISVQLPSISDPGIPITFIWIPFPYLNYEGASRIEKVLYNSVSHCNVGDI